MVEKAVSISLCYKMIVTVTFCCIVWNIWKNRCSHRMEGCGLSQAMLIDRIKEEVRIVILKARNLCKHGTTDRKILDRFQLKEVIPRIDRALITKWIHPPTGRLKLNCDGCSKGNSGESGGGFVLPNSKGDVIWALVEYYGVQSNTVAKARAILHGLQKCVIEGRNRITIESDSLTVVSCLKRLRSVPWSITYEIRLIGEICKDLDIEFCHTFRENNQMEDFLANLDCRDRRYIEFLNRSDMHKLLIGMYRMDREHEI